MDEVVERLVKIAAADEEFATATREHEKFKDLVKTPAWVSLETHVRRILDKSLAQLAAILLHSEDPLDQRKLDYMRGYVKGMQAVVDFPTNLDEDFDRQIERAWRRAHKAAELSGDDTEQEAVNAISD